jgi:hypothetical protein
MRINADYYTLDCRRNQRLLCAGASRAYPNGPPSVVRQPLGSASEQGVNAAHGEGARLGIGCMKDGSEGV